MAFNVFAAQFYSLMIPSLCDFLARLRSKRNLIEAMSLYGSEPNGINQAGSFIRRFLCSTMLKRRKKIAHFLPPLHPDSGKKKHSRVSFDFVSVAVLCSKYFSVLICRWSSKHQKRSDAVQQLDGDGLSITPATGVSGANITAFESNRSLVLDAKPIFLQRESSQRSPSAPSNVRIELQKRAASALTVQLKSLND